MNFHLLKDIFNISSFSYPYEMPGPAALNPLTTTFWTNIFSAADAFNNRYTYRSRGPLQGPHWHGPGVAHGPYRYPLIQANPRSRRIYASSSGRPRARRSSRRFDYTPFNAGQQYSYHFHNQKNISSS